MFFFYAPQTNFNTKLPIHAIMLNFSQNVTQTENPKLSKSQTY